MMAKHKPKVLITYLEAGMGHIMSAISISESLHQVYGDALEIIDDYVCRDAGKTLRQFENSLVKSVKAYSKGRAASAFQYGLLKVLGDRLARWGLYNVVWGRYKKAMINKFRTIKPDVIISTHFAVSDFAATYRDKYNPQCKVITYNPDYNTLGFWGKRDDLFIVNNPVAYRHCLQKKFPERIVREVPFIARKVLKDCDLTKEQARAKHNLPLNKFTVTLVDGAYGAAKLRTFTDELLKTDREITLLVGACKNTELYHYYQNLRDQLPPNITLVPLEFRMDIYEFYRASDIVITKTGASICLDCLYMNVPMLVNYCAQPIEVFNRDLFINEYKIGEFIPDAVACRQRVEQFIDEPRLLDEYVANTKRFDKHHDGSQKVADLIFDICAQTVV